MDRPALLALPVVLLSALVVPLRSIVAFGPFRDLLELTTLSLLARPLWMVVCLGGVAAVGYAYGGRTEGGEPRTVLGVAALSAFAGVAVGSLIVGLTTEGTVVGRGSLPIEIGIFGGYAVLDAAMIGLLTVGGYALSSDARSGRSG